MPIGLVGRKRGTSAMFAYRPGGRSLVLVVALPVAVPVLLIRRRPDRRRRGDGDHLRRRWRAAWSRKTNRRSLRRWGDRGGFVLAGLLRLPRARGLVVLRRAVRSRGVGRRSRHTGRLRSSDGRLAAALRRPGRLVDVRLLLLLGLLRL